MSPHRPRRSAGDAADDLDRRMMKRAIALARRGEGRVEPNPMVGCVIVRAGRVIGEGHHRRFGGPHAEIEALCSCEKSPRGATVYVSLEPCRHHGKTPPCADALIEAGVGRVVVAARDPSPHGGGGNRRLRAAGIHVDTGLCAGEVADLLAPFIVRHVLGRPHVIAKWAQSLDGKLATHTGDSKWISSEASRRRAHVLRGRVDAVLVGSGTVKADDPMLTARGVPVRRPALRVVLDGRLRIPEECQLIVTARAHPVLVMTSAARVGTPKARRLSGKGVEVIACRQRGGRLAPDACLAELMKRDATNVMVEGGPSVLTAFFAEGLVDEAIVFTSPRLIGGNRAPGVLGGRGARRVDAAVTPVSVQTRRSGPDTLHRMKYIDPLELLQSRRPGG